MVGDLRRTEPVAIERVEVACGTARQLLYLPLGHFCAGLLRDQLDDLVERRTRGLLGNEPANLIRVHLRSQLHCRVERRESVGARRLIQVALELDLAELGHHRARAPVRRGALDSVGATDVHRPLLLAPPIEVRLHHRPQHLAALGPQHPLDLMQRRVHRVLAREVVLELLDVLSRFAETDCDRRSSQRARWTWVMDGTRTSQLQSPFLRTRLRSGSPRS